MAGGLMGMGTVTGALTDLPTLVLLEPERIRQLLFVLDLAGTFVFALSGAMLAVRERLDVFGIMVLAVAAAVSGGVVRDLLIGAVPPASVGDWRYVAVAVLAGLITIPAYVYFERIGNAINMFDAAGLALFAVSGAQKALAHGLNPPMAAALGMVTGIGGGIVRDVLVARKPVVLHRDLYALAALAGAAVVVVGHLLGWLTVPTAIGGALVCFGIRMIAIRQGWRLPVVSLSGDEGGKERR